MRAVNIYFPDKQSGVWLNFEPGKLIAQENIATHVEHMFTAT